MGTQDGGRIGGVGGVSNLNTQIENFAPNHNLEVYS